MKFEVGRKIEFVNDRGEHFTGEVITEPHGFPMPDDVWVRWDNGQVCSYDENVLEEMVYPKTEDLKLTMEVEAPYGNVKIDLGTEDWKKMVQHWIDQIKYFDSRNPERVPNFNRDLEGYEYLLNHGTREVFDQFMEFKQNSRLGLGELFRDNMGIMEKITGAQ